MKTKRMFINTNNNHYTMNEIIGVLLVAIVIASFLWYALLIPEQIKNGAQEFETQNKTTEKPMTLLTIIYIK